MKNDITADEWSVLGEYLRFGGHVYEDWELDGALKEKSALLDSAKGKFQRVSKVIDSWKIQSKNQI